MIRINLLPIRQLRKTKRLKTELLAFSLAMAIILVFLGGFAITLISKAGSLKTEIAGLEQKKKSYDPILKQITKLQKDKELLEQKLATIDQLQAQSQLPVRLLDEIAARTPTARMWLTSMQQTSGKLQLQGVALDNETIAQYMLQLEASPYLSNTELSSTAQTDVAGKKLKSFSLSLNVIEPKN